MDKVFHYIDKKSLKGYVAYALDWRKSRTAKTELPGWMEQQVAMAREDDRIGLVASTIMDNVKNPKDYDKIMYECLRWVRININYVSDMKQYGAGEVWANYIDIINSKADDCDGGNGVIYILARLCGVPADRMMCMCGTTSFGGHFWLGYRTSFFPHNWVFLDYCFYPNLQRVENRKQFSIKNKKIISLQTGRQDERYYKLWWGFSEKAGYLNVHY